MGGGGERAWTGKREPTPPVSLAATPNDSTDPTGGRTAAPAGWQQREPEWIDRWASERGKKRKEMRDFAVCSESFPRISEWLDPLVFEKKADVTRLPSPNPRLSFIKILTTCVFAGEPTLADGSRPGQNPRDDLYGRCSALDVGPQCPAPTFTPCERCFIFQEGIPLIQ